MAYSGSAGDTRRPTPQGGETVKRCGISFEALADYNDGRADENAAEEIRRHLSADCGHCRENLEWLRRAAQTMRAASEIQVPQTLVSRLHDVYADRFRMPVRKSLLARLTFDSRSTPAFAGARGAAAEPVRLNFSTDLHDIDLWEEPAGPGRWYIIGQVLPREGAEVLQPEEIVFTSADGSRITVTPELPEFHLPSVPTGTYEVAVRLADTELLMRDVSVGI